MFEAESHLVRYLGLNDLSICHGLEDYFLLFSKPRELHNNKLVPHHNIYLRLVVRDVCIHIKFFYVSNF